jgi:hypothetical protein
MVHNVEKYRISKRPDIREAQNCMAGSFTDSEGGFFLSGIRDGNSLNSITRSLNVLKDMTHWNTNRANTMMQLSWTPLRRDCIRFRYESKPKSDKVSLRKMVRIRTGCDIRFTNTLRRMEAYITANMIPCGPMD